jgi:hypothetical protein
MARGLPLLHGTPYPPPPSHGGKMNKNYYFKTGSKKLFEKKIYLDLTGGSQTTPLQKSRILGVGEGLRPLHHSIFMNIE